MAQIDVNYVEKLYPIFTKPKRIKIIVGGRGSTKSVGISDYVISLMTNGALVCCAREQLNSIEESVHRTILDEIERLQIPGFSDTKTGISHEDGGRCFYRGLSRNITSLKSTLSGVDLLWIEEGEDLSSNTLRVLTASVRLNAADTEKAMAGEDVKMPEIIITMNRGSRADAVAEKWLERAEPELERCGYYEDENLMVVELNYTDMPQKWFELSGLETERQDDEKHLSRGMYEHKWLGKYLETVDNALIQPEWVEACIDAHEKLNFKPVGARVVAHDPSDDGDDSKGLSYRHGSVFLEVLEETTGDSNEGMDWALDFTLSQENPTHFVWDGDGLGLSLRRQVSQALDGKNIQQVMFRGGNAPNNPEAIYDPIIGDAAKGESNKDAFLNQRAQYYWMLRDRIYNTYLAVTEDKYIDPDEMISFSSEITNLKKLKIELCRLPIKLGAQRRQLLSKEVMKKPPYRIKSPNLADSVMMSLAINGKIVNTTVKTPPPIRPMGRRNNARIR